MFQTQLPFPSLAACSRTHSQLAPWVWGLGGGVRGVPSNLHWLPALGFYKGSWTPHPLTEGEIICSDCLSEPLGHLLLFVVSWFHSVLPWVNRRC